ncbi:MAG TPA: undecaprenyl-phosphate glucose phosphotransferase [Gammaproteobacteria bacterium]|nr:undecaprenyl-phosphate glucose phosphotransferase [Gammaproteobacteria bacterium]
MTKISLQVTLLTALRMLLVPAVTIAMLIACTSFLDVRFTRAYVALAIITALLTWIFMGQDESQSTAVQANGLTFAGQIGIGWLGVVGALLLIGYATKSSEIFSRRALFLWLVATPAVLVGASLCLRQCMRMAMLSARNARGAVIVGASKMSLELARIIHDRPELGLKLRRLYSAGGADDSPLAAHELAFLRDNMGVETCEELAAVRDYVNVHHIPVVFIALPTGSPNMRAMLEELRDTTSSVYLIPDVSLFDLIQAQSADIQGIPVVALCESPLHGVRYVMKRATDIVFAALLLLLASPLMIGVAIAIKLTSPGRALFKQDRYGLDGERITVYKFRSMTCCDNGDHIVQATRNDARVTRVGRFLRRTSLDELPQLINVLQGRMSLVGPRPHAVAHNEEYRKLIRGYMVRHKVTPGITGLAQVNGCRGETHSLEDMRRRVDYDLEYLRHWCWLLDIKIMIRTFVLVFRDKHAY